MKLERSVEKEDLKKIEKVLIEIFDNGKYIDVQRLGGMTNHSYRIAREDGEEYLVRIPGEGTEKMINRAEERKSTELACRLGIDSELLYFGNDGTKVMKFISGAKEMSAEVMRQRETIKKAATIFRKLHLCGENTGVHFEVFEMALEYENIIKEYNVPFYEDYTEVKEAVMKIKMEIDMTRDIERVPCHNDSLVGNWVFDKNEKLYLIDWEYSGMNEAMWDLSCLSIECDYTEQNDKELLEAYFEREVDTEEMKYFIASKMYVDFLWTLWGLARVPYDGEFMQQYADNRYIRLKKNIDAYNRIKE